MSISIPTSAKSAGRICSATSAATPTGWPSRRPSANTALALTGRVFAAWRAYQHEHHDRGACRPRSHRSRPSCGRCSKHARRKSQRTRWHRRFANNLLKVWPALWTFTTHPGVEPTNNPAERALRSPVIHRKLSLGTQSDDGERFAERALSAAATCRQQHRSLFSYLSDLMTAHTRGDPFPGSPEPRD